MEPEPFYKKSALVLLGITLSVYILYMLSDILIPLAFAGLFAILLNSMSNRFMRLGVPKVPAILLTLFIAILIFCAILYFLSVQLIQFGEVVLAL